METNSERIIAAAPRLQEHARNSGSDAERRVHRQLQALEYRLQERTRAAG